MPPDDPNVSRKKWLLFVAIALCLAILAVVIVLGAGAPHPSPAERAVLPLHRDSTR